MKVLRKCMVWTRALLLLGLSQPAAASPEPLLVNSAPAGMDVPCPTPPLPYRFAAQAQSFDRDSAFWAMWMSVRAFTSDQAATPSELARVGFHRYTEIDDPWTGLKGFIAGSDEAVVVAFRGSEEAMSWLTDVDLALVDGAPMQLPGKVHEGFGRALAGSWEVIQSTVDQYGGRQKPLWITGHSLGGALATLAAYRFAALGYRLAPLYTFAAPRSGDPTAGSVGNKLLHGEHYRFINNDDLVPHLPTRIASAALFKDIVPGPLGELLAQVLLEHLDYAHAGSWIRFDAQGSASAPTTGDDAADDTFWESLAQLTRQGGFGTTVEVVHGRQPALHPHQRYLCLLQTYREAAR